MSTYKTSYKNTEYVHNYPRSTYNNNSPSYNQQYYAVNRRMLVKKKKLRRIELKLRKNFAELDRSK